MTGSLLRKELIGALPLACLWWFFWASALLEHTLTGVPNLVKFAEAFEGWRNPGSVAAVGAIAALWFANSTITSEHASGTLEFLDSIPTSRDRVFVTKIVAGLAMLWSGPVLQVVVAYGYHAISRSSIDDPVYAGIVAPWLLLAFAELTILLFVAAALSFVRRFAWMLAVVVLLTYAVLHTKLPQIGILDVSAICDPAVVGTTLAIPWRLLAVQGGVAVLCLGIAWFLFRGSGDRLVRAGESLTKSVPGRLVLVAAMVLSVGVWIALLVLVRRSSNDNESEVEDEHGVVYVGWTRSHASTEHYSFTFPASLSVRAGPLLVNADECHDRVRKYFEADAVAKIDVDASGAGPAMYAGRAFHETIQIDLPGLDDPAELVAVLGHETSHVYIDAVAHDRLTKEFGSTRCLHEGIASYVEHTLFRSDAELARLRRGAALAHAWKPIEFEKFIDDATLAAERDPMLVYPVGNMLIGALVEVGGEHAPVRLLHAFGSADHAQGIHGLDLWRDAFQAAGLNLEATASRLMEDLDAEVKRNAGLIASLPRPRGRIVETTRDDESWVGVTPVLAHDLPKGWRVVVRFRRGGSTSIEDYRDAVANEGTHWVRRKELPGRAAWYEMGLASGAERLVVWDEWTETALGR